MAENLTAPMRVHVTRDRELPLAGKTIDLDTFAVIRPRVRPRELPFIEGQSQHGEEVQGALRHQRRRVGVVRGKRGVDEEVFVAGVDEQFGLV
jgi:hypothetical protein